MVCWRRVGEISISLRSSGAREGRRVGGESEGARVEREHERVSVSSSVLRRFGRGRFARALPVAVLAALAAPTVGIVSTAHAKALDVDGVVRTFDALKPSDRSGVLLLLRNCVEYFRDNLLKGDAKAAADGISVRFKATAPVSGRELFDSLVESAVLLGNSGVAWNDLLVQLSHFTGLSNDALKVVIAKAREAVESERKKLEPSTIPRDGPAALAVAPLAVDALARVEVHTDVVFIVSRGGKPVAGESVEITLPSGVKITRKSEEGGRIKIIFSAAGRCAVSAGGIVLAEVEVTEPAKPAGVAEPARAEAGAPVEGALPAGVPLLPDATEALKPARVDAGGEAVAGAPKPVGASVASPSVTSAGVVGTGFVELPFVAGSLDAFGETALDPLGLTRFVNAGYRVKASLRPYARDKDSALGSVSVLVAFDHESREVVITDDLTKADSVLSRRLVDRGKVGVEARTLQLPVEVYGQLFGVYESIASRTEVNERTPARHGFDLDFEVGVKVAEFFSLLFRASTDREVGYSLVARGAVPWSFADLVRLTGFGAEGGRTAIAVSGRIQSLENPADFNYSPYSEADAEIAGQLVQILQASGVSVLVDSTLFGVGEGVAGKRLFSLGLAGGFEYSERRHGHADAFRRLVELGGSLILSDILSGRVVALVGSEGRIIRFEGTSERDDSSACLAGVRGSGVLDVAPLSGLIGIPPDAELRAVVSGERLPGGEQKLLFTLEGRW
ncbi:hypothetical protein HY992_05500 [Candidatus Micrarchaeota archaeon]|nr:hypothetical protein [Candidatus Micrarchaeota archaeon]